MFDWTAEKNIVSSILKNPPDTLIIYIGENQMVYKSLDSFEKYKDLYRKELRPFLINNIVEKDVPNSILDMMNKILSSPEKVEAELSGEEKAPAIWIESAYIGGNPNQKTQTYCLMRDQLLLHSYNQNKFENITTGEKISLYGGYELHVLKRLRLDEMSGRVTPGEKNNGTSLVLALMEKENQEFQKVVFPGDANVHTFAQWETEYTQQLALFRNADWLAPHHGSNSFKSSNEQNEECAFYRILQNSNARNMIISAGENNRYKHPYNSFVELMDMYYTSIEMFAEEHVIRCNDEDSSRGTLALKEITFPLYTLCTKVPNEYCMWDGPQSANKILLEDSRISSETRSKQQEVPAPGLFFRRK